MIEPKPPSAAVALRRAGRSRREIKQALGITGGRALSRALHGEPPPDWTRRPNAKDNLRARGRELRAQGRSYTEIAAELGVSKSTCSLWLRDLPRPARLSPEESRERAVVGARRYWERERARRDAERRAVKDAAAAEIGTLTDREILIAGAIAYWCEGAKDKPHRRDEHVCFMNSDPRLITLFLRFLDLVDVDLDRVRCSVHIHETADVVAATRFWMELTGVPSRHFKKPIIKRHRPSTVRKNVGTNYQGCLRVDVLRSAKLYRRIEGWAVAVMSGGYARRAEVGAEEPDREGDSGVG